LSKPAACSRRRYGDEAPLAEKMIRIETRIEAIQQGIVEIEALIRTRQAGVPPF